MLPVRLRLANTDRIDITLSVSEFTSSSESASDSLVTSAGCSNTMTLSVSEHKPRLVELLPTAKRLALTVGLKDTERE